MTLQEAMSARHSVRRYKDTPLSDEIVSRLNRRIEEHNEKYGISMKLMTQSKDAMPAIFAKTMSKGVQNYIILAGPNAADTDEKLGYSSADLILYAQTLGPKATPHKDRTSCFVRHLLAPFSSYCTKAP